MTALHRAIQNHMAQKPDAVAVVLGRGKTISYGALAGQIAGVQTSFSAARPAAIGVLATRVPEAYVAVLAAFFSGIKFVPLNPELPKERLQKIVALSGVDLVCHGSKTAQLAQALDVPLCDVSQIEGVSPVTYEPIDPTAFAYHMFTSGSTGEPKGVPISYSNLDHYITAIQAATGLLDGGRYSQFFDLSFDLSMHDIFLALANGGAIVPAGDMELLMPHSYIQKKQVDHWFSVPLLAPVAVRGLAGLTPSHTLSTAMFCGEPLPSDYAAAFGVFLAQDASLYNLYGPTEATIAFTARRFEAGLERYPVVPLGEPFGQNAIAIEEAEGRILTQTDLEGAEGELLLAGPQVFGGYLPAQSHACFTGASSQYYRSGDRVRMEGGELLHLGRNDSQIKLRGYRIELGDVEAAFRKCFDVTAAAAIVVGEREARQIAVAYEAAAPIEDLSRLEAALPTYMHPQLVQHLDRLPTNINGKIDRSALKAMAWHD